MHKVPEGVLRFIPLVSTSQYNWSSGAEASQEAGFGHAAYWRPLETRWTPAGKWARTRKPDLNNAGTLALLRSLGMCLVCPPGFQLFVTVLVANVRLIFSAMAGFFSLAGMSKNDKNQQEFNFEGGAGLSESGGTLLWAGLCESPGRRSVLPGCWWTVHTTSFFRRSVDEWEFISLLTCTVLTLHI